jgi:endonuclease III related protein
MQKSREDINQRLLLIYELLNSYFGDLHWWPGESPFEVIVGAILTQNTNWKNVEKAIGNLKATGTLSPERILMADDHILADMIKSSGYHNVKARRLKAFVRYLHEEFSGSLDRTFSEDLGTLREKLLAIKGIGEETADSILLYAGNKPIFVVDAYTRRILERHDLIHAGETYTNIQNLFMNHLPQSVSLYNQYHALLVNTGKYFCKKAPQCMGCPLRILT